MILLHAMTLSLPFLALILAYLFSLYLPTKKEQKINSQQIKIGSKIVTRGGIVGVIRHRLGKTILLQLYDGSITEIEQDSVVKIIKK